MKKIVSLPEDPVEIARRYHHLVTAAVEQFNAGNLGGAEQMFELASTLAAEKKVDRGYTDRSWRAATKRSTTCACATTWSGPTATRSCRP